MSRLPRERRGFRARLGGAIGMLPLTLAGGPIETPVRGSTRDLAEFS